MNRITLLFVALTAFAHAVEKPELVEHARQICAEARRPDPNWPLEGRSEDHEKNTEQAWRIKGERERSGWTPANAIPYKP